MIAPKTIYESDGYNVFMKNDDSRFIVLLNSESGSYQNVPNCNAVADALNGLDPNEQSKVELTGEYHADCNALINVLSNVRSKIERIRDEISSLPCRKFSDGHPDQMITKAKCLEIIDRISNENDMPVIGGD